MHLGRQDKVVSEGSNIRDLASDSTCGLTIP
jgi:hypothetical protein